MRRGKKKKKTVGQAPVIGIPKEKKQESMVIVLKRSHYSIKQEHTPRRE